ncbi:OmpA family protein [Flavobacterium fluvii]|uniref:OmpA family protein n=1 Tax=Flavobacterium fluvii TaxID=468056 RepID=A0A1M5EWG5_9FLAO|nr:OmpA family protein [Flavobacterium fluvii]SHF83392.1 OmpA family protein [Flavobacterium fluvii]
MKRGFQILLFLTFGFLSAQENAVQSVYFEFDKFVLNKNEINTIIYLVNSPNSSQFESVQLYGYCDDRGSEDYNNKLSDKRVSTVQKILLANGISQNKIFICEGKGRVNLDKDTVKNLERTRYKNRRVDLVFVKKSVFNYVPSNPKVGDLITLEWVHFEMGSSVLSMEAKKELDRTIVSLEKHKTLRFEIKGHVCCTSSKYSDAIDKETQNRNLSLNRAKNVFSYLRSKGISPYRMTYKGYGNQFPLGKGDAFDRRVELLITKL